MIAVAALVMAPPGRTGLDVTRAQGDRRRPRARVAVVRADDQPLAVEYRGAFAGTRDPRCVALGYALGDLRVRRAGGDRRRAVAGIAVEPAPRPERDVGERSHRGPHESDLRGPEAVRRQAPGGLRLGLLLEGVRRPSPGASDELDDRLSYDPDHGRRGAGDHRVRALRRRCSWRPSRRSSTGPGVRRRASWWEPASRHSSCTRWSTPTSSRTRSRGCCSESASPWRSRGPRPPAALQARGACQKSPQRQRGASGGRDARLPEASGQGRGGLPVRGNRGQGHRGRDLPLYTRHVAPGEYGAANILLTSVILASIVLRLGLGEAFVRFCFDDRDPVRRLRIARSATAAVAWTDDARRRRGARLRRPALGTACSAITTRSCSTARRSACGPSRTSKWPTRSCGSRNARGPT